MTRIALRLPEVTTLMAARRMRRFLVRRPSHIKLRDQMSTVTGGWVARLTDRRLSHGLRLALTHTHHPSDGPNHSQHPPQGQASARRRQRAQVGHPLRLAR